MASLLLLVVAVRAQVPFMQNYSAADYQAHNRNFDIVATDDGMVFVANFEGLLYYDKAEWRVIHTPQITRVTALCRDARGTVWAGGYNYMGYLKADDHGLLRLHEACAPGAVQGEVEQIWTEQDRLCLLLSDGKTYTLADGQLTPRSYEDPLTVRQAADRRKKQQRLGQGLEALVADEGGILLKDSLGRTICAVSEENGLCSDNINGIAYDGKGLLWGATEKGIFAMAVPTAYIRYTANEGLRGEVFSFGQIDDTVYAGTLNGLYRKEGLRFVPVAGVTHTCWQIISRVDGLVVATSNGVYRVQPDNRVQQLSSGNTICILPQPTGFYAGELDGVYLYTTGGARTKVCDAEKVTKLYQDKTGTIWLQTIFGQVWQRKPGDEQFTQVAVGDVKGMPATLVKTANEVLAISANATEPIPYPLFSCTDQQGCTWLTNNEGRQLSTMKPAVTAITEQQLRPLSDYAVQALLHTSNQLWIGGDYGVVVLFTDFADPAVGSSPKMLIRSVVLGADSVLWGGAGTMPARLPKLDSHDRHLRFTFALDHAPLVGKTLYRYRLSQTGAGNSSWSAWSAATQAVFAGLSSGNYSFEVQALTASGTMTDVTSIDFSIGYPFYLRWYMLLLYLVLAALLVTVIFKLRLQRLEREKLRLEAVVQERTAEVVRQKNEIEEKSVSLEHALQELGEAQHELIRQEKMATVGKLTQGLIDRILNPLNYINNFAKLSEGLVGDLEENMQDAKDTMDADCYDDTIDVLGMLRGNLQKVSEHGQNTTRTLKAMEEMLKDRSGGIVPMDLVPVLRQDFQMLQQYYAADISTHHIAVRFDCPHDQIDMRGNADQLSKTVMSLLGNAVYAVVKKAQRESFQPEVLLAANADGERVNIVVRDNGIGIEQTIIGKVFDPFFTTKTTGEASGVGLYLSREIAQNHGGDIQVESVKGAYTQFTITLPMSSNTSNT
jgi:signal transduction histidine kinase/ligand-binding sensor domain-containing protein